MFSDVLLTVDFDRTLTAPDGSVPRRNLEAIDYFIENHGCFTVNTGRSTGTFWQYLGKIPANAPYLLYNGSAAWENGKLTNLVPIDLPMWPTLETVHQLFPDINLEVQGVDQHYHLEPDAGMVALYSGENWRFSVAKWGQPPGPFLKFSLFGTPENGKIADMYRATPAQLARFEEAVQTLKRLFGDKIEIFRPAPRIIDVHAKGVSKIKAARRLQGQLGRKILVCVGDGENDISMLNGADYAFCPEDAIIAEHYKNVCCCAEGAVADVIYKKIPEILALTP